MNTSTNETLYTYRGKEYTRSQISELIKSHGEEPWECAKCGKDAYNCKCYEVK